MKSICFFNNKGGVGKTTLLSNVSSYLATEFSLRVVVVDADPQCNATQLILGEDRVQRLYRLPDARKPSSPRNRTTLFDVLRPITIGESAISTPPPLIKKHENRFGVDLLPGHPQLALLEDRLSQAWLQLSGGDVGGARQSNWNTQLCRALDKSYDIAFFDVGPSLGALNRSVLLGADFFVTPMGCDVFSLLGVTNIAQWLTSWFTHYERSIEACRRAGFSVELEEFGVRESISGIARFIGYTVQQYITKSKEGKRRATTSYEAIKKKIPPTVQQHLGSFVAAHIKAQDLELPDVPHMYSLVPLAQSASCPIHVLSSKDGLAGAQPQQKAIYTDFIRKLAEAVLTNVDVEVSTT
jgi:cellulose biosynthesis protein BcsQ